MLSASSEMDDEMTIPTDEKTKQHDNNLHDIKSFLGTLSIPPTVPNLQHTQFIKRALEFFISGNRLWCKDSNGQHQLVLFSPDRLRILKTTHDELGHKGIYSTCRTIADQFWWPLLNDNITWYIKTCHQCQLRSIEKVVIPPTVATPTPLFRKAYVDSMHMPTAQGFSYVIQARCSLTGWPEWRKLKKEIGRTIGTFLFEEILCRWGGLEEIVTDNGTPFVAALDWLANKYHIRHIRISPYNSKVNGIVERSHRTIRDSLVKACDGDITQWPNHAAHVFWADRITTRKATGHSPFYMTHGVEPLLPLDIIKATFLVPEITTKLDTASLIASQAHQLAKREEDDSIQP